MPDIDTMARELMAAREVMTEARNASREAMHKATASYHKVLGLMLREGVTEVDVGDTVIRLQTGYGAEWLEFVPKEAPKGRDRPEFGGLKTTHDRRGE